MQYPALARARCNVNVDHHAHEQGTVAQRVEPDIAAALTHLNK